MLVTSLFAEASFNQTAVCHKAAETDTVTWAPLPFVTLAGFFFSTWIAAWGTKMYIPAYHTHIYLLIETSVVLGRGFWK